MTHTYVCERDGNSVYILDRKTKPRMGQVITAYGFKWQVWYIEYHGKSCAARLEPYLEFNVGPWK